MAAQPVVLRICGSASAQLVSSQYRSPVLKKRRPLRCSNLRATDDKSKAEARLLSQASLGSVGLHRVWTDFVVAESRLDEAEPVDDGAAAGLFSLKKKIEDAIFRAEMLAETALELEESKCIEQEEMIQENNLWDDLAGSSEIFVNLAGSTKLVDALKDLKYKAEEAKLITELAEMDAINYGLFKQAYEASVDVSKFLDQYEMAKLMKGQYDIEGASLIIKARNQSVYSEAWVKQLLNMYSKWAEKQGFKARIADMDSSASGGLKSATIDLEFQFAYGYLAGERGIHHMISSHNVNEAGAACVDVIPLFLDLAPDLKIADDEVIITTTSSQGEYQGKVRHGVSVQHIPSGITVNCSGERNHFANKMIALNRMKAKLLVIAKEQAVSDVRHIKRSEIIDVLQVDVRRYVFYPYKLVRDLRTGIEFPDLNSILEGHIEPLIGAHINCRQ